MKQSIPIPQVFFTQNALNEMLNSAEKSQETETGGLLLGKICTYENSRAFVVTKISGPGPKSKLLPDGFSPDIEYYQEIRRKNPELIYLGEWHKHPHRNLQWSFQDLVQAKKIFSQEPVQELLCPICAPFSLKKGIQKIKMRCFYIHSQLNNFLPISYSVIPELQNQHQPFHYLAIEESVVHEFIASRKKTTQILGDSYPTDGVAHLFRQPFQANESILMINARRCNTIPIQEEIKLAVLVKTQKGKSPQVKGYAFENSQVREITTQLISTTEDIFSRNHALLETKVLCKKHVAMLGLGSIGSIAAIELTRAGVSTFTLIDPDTVQIHNLCRHLCDLSELGVLKVNAIARRIRKILPHATIHTHAQDANQDPDKTLALCQQADILLVTTDTENSRRLANWIAHQLQIPVIFAGLLERAIGGRVWRVIPGQTACYECYPATQQILNPGPVSYSEIQSPHDLTIQPGLGNDIAFITHLAVRFTIDTLIQKPLPYPILFWFNHRSEKWGNDSLTLYKVETLPKNPNCAFCSVSSN